MGAGQRHIPQRRRGHQHASTERRLIMASPKFQHSSLCHSACQSLCKVVQSVRPKRRGAPLSACHCFPDFEYLKGGMDMHKQSFPHPRAIEDRRDQLHHGGKLERLSDVSDIPSDARTYDRLRHRSHDDARNTALRLVRLHRQDQAGAVENRRHVVAYDLVGQRTIGQAFQPLATVARQDHPVSLVCEDQLQQIGEALIGFRGGGFGFLARG